MPRRDNKKSKFGITSEERMEHFRKKITENFGDITIRNREHLKELMRDKGYRKYYTSDGEEHFGYPTPTQQQLAWDELSQTPRKEEILESTFAYNVDENKNHHANYNFTYNGTKYIRGQFIPKKFR